MGELKVFGSICSIHRPTERSVDAKNIFGAQKAPGVRQKAVRGRHKKGEFFPAFLDSNIFLGAPKKFSEGGRQMVKLVNDTPLVTLSCDNIWFA